MFCAFDHFVWKGHSINFKWYYYIIMTCKHSVGSRKGIKTTVLLIFLKENNKNKDGTLSCLNLGKVTKAQVLHLVRTQMVGRQWNRGKQLWIYNNAKQIFGNRTTHNLREILMFFLTFVISDYVAIPFNGRLSGTIEGSRLTG